MSIRHTLMKGVALSTLLVLVAGPAGAADSTATTTRGTAATTSVPLHVKALDLPIDLGSTVLMATTDSDTTTGAPWSTVQLTLANIDGTAFEQVDVSSDGTTTAEGVEVNEDATFGAVGATVASVLAFADDDAGSATAALTTLTTEATVLNALGLGATVSDALSSVDDARAAAGHALVVSDIDLDVAAVLGGILAELPLDTLIALAGDLGVTVPDGLGDVSTVVAATEALLVDVAAAVTEAGDVETTAAALLADDGGKLAELQALLAELGSLTLTDLADFLLSDPLLADCVGEAPIADAEACVQGLIDDHLLTLAGEELALSTAVTDYLDALADVVLSAGAIDGSSLSVILDGLIDLINGLLAVDLGGIGEITISQEVRAVGTSLEDSFASHTCLDTAITAPGADDVTIVDCDADGTDALQTALDTITGTLGTILTTVGGVDVGDGVSLELFGNVQDTVAERDDGFITASSVMEVLRLTVPDITVRACDVAVVGEIACALGEGLEILSPLTDAVGDLGDAQDTVDTALGSVTDLLAALSSTVNGTPAEDPIGAVNAAIGILQTTLEGLDFGTLGDAAGVALPGATIVVDPTLEAEHQVVTASADPGGPADPAPDTPGDDPTLPNTGGGAALLAILAIGAGTWLWRRREQE